jgi:hypothetical protein
MRGDTLADGLAKAASAYSAPFLRAIGWALTLDEKRRPQSVDAWRTVLLAAASGPAVPAPAPAATIERTLRVERPAPLRLGPTPTKRSWLPLGTALGVAFMLGAFALAMKHYTRPADAAPHDEGRFRAQVLQQFRAADTNADGYLSAEEMRRFPFLAKEFARLDTDGDGRISLPEFEQARRAQVERRLAKRTD